MKKAIVLLLLITLGIVIWQKEFIIKTLMQEVVLKYSADEIVINKYHKNDEYLLYKETDNFNPKSRDEFNDIVYTILNSGMDSFSFFCDLEYKDCADDFTNFIKNYDDIEIINNYVSPFNSFENLSVTVDNFNRITIDISKLYSDSQIAIVDATIDSFIKNNIDNNMSDYDKIKLFHDYVINTTKYDNNFKLDTDKSTYPTHPYSAYGLLTEHKAICSGYSDTMAIYLNKLGIKNYKISSEQHIWNYVYLDDNWYHLDLTWDDPVNNKNIDMLTHDFFLITTDELEKKDITEHNYNKNIYSET